MSTLQTGSYWRENNLSYRDATFSQTKGASIWELCPQLAIADPSVGFTFFDDFFEYDATATVGNWVAVADGAGAGAKGDAAGGILTITTGTTNNDEVYLSSAAEIFKVAASKPIWFEARLACTEISTNTANWIVGLSDTVTANSLVDNGAGPMASYDGIVFFKVDGGLSVGFETSNAGTQVTTAAATTEVSGTYLRLGFRVNPTSATAATVTPYVNGVAGTDHALTITGMDEMHVLVGVKNGYAGSPATAQTLSVDYIKCVQIR